VRGHRSPLWWRMLYWRFRSKCAKAYTSAYAWTPDDPEYIAETGDVGA
jgi:hypothetical protein